MAPAAARTEHPFDPCFEKLAINNRKAVVVAVSGGSDSFALLDLFVDFARRRHPALKVHAVTVDHGLRSEAAEEARHVGELAARLGVPHAIRKWEGAKPHGGIIDAAREARHGLLAEAAREAGTDLVLTGHTLDDQAETVAMRGKRGAGRGSAGMAEATLHEWRTWFARPLLTVRRSALRAVLEGRGIHWVDDPTNQDMRYERARVRAAMTDGEVTRLAAQANSAAGEREDLGYRAAALIDSYAAMPASGLIRVDPGFTSKGDSDAALYAFRILLATAGGTEHLPDAVRSEELLNRLAGGPFKATLSRAVLDCRQSGIFLYREKRNLPPRSSFAAGVWDGRFWLGGKGIGEYAIGAPDPAIINADIAAAHADAPASVRRAACAGLPALWAGEVCIGLAENIFGIRCEPVVGPWVRFLPAFDHAPACAMARLVGAQEPSPAPLAGHKVRRA
ncbi:MAG: tRNA lysidine(34) synthetase TilS [Rhizobiaceae bacterium]|nr:tRNA lysidine(34) synthetase TilS [Rhizobiaceae bacterium]